MAANRPASYFDVSGLSQKWADTSVRPYRSERPVCRPLYLARLKPITYFDDSGVLCDCVAQNPLASFWVAANRPASFLGNPFALIWLAADQPGLLIVIEINLYIIDI
jgi:hypothetical protein